MKITKLIITLILLIFTGCKSSKAPEKTSESRQGVRVALIEKAYLSKPIHSTGYIATSEELKLGFKTGGLVIKALVKEGDQIKKGQLLASLNLTEIQEGVEQARKGYEKANRDFVRAEKLYADSVATLELLQNTRTFLDLSASVLKAAEFNLKYSRIHAPNNGVILKQLVRENEFVAPGYPVYVLGVSDKNWVVRAGLADRDLVRVQLGDSLSVSVDAWPDHRFSASLTSMDHLANPLTGTFEIEALLEPSPLKLVSGFIAHLEIFPARKDSFLLVPTESLVYANQNEGFVFVPGSENQALKIKVNIAWLSEEKVVLLSGLEGYTEVITAGAAFLKDGELIEITR